MKASGVKYSWIIPVKNEESSLAELITSISEASLRVKTVRVEHFEIIAVNDYSTDNSRSVLKQIAKNTPSLRIFRFESPQGKWAALNYGFSKSSGEIIITLDSDLQDDPAEVKKMLHKMTSQNYDLISGWRQNRQDPAYKVAVSKIGNGLISLLSSHNFKDLNSPFKIYKREVFENLPRSGALLRFSLLFAFKLGYKTVEIPITHKPRLYGKSKFGVVKYLRIIYDLILIQMLFSGSGRIFRK